MTNTRVKLFVRRAGLVLMVTLLSVTLLLTALWHRRDRIEDAGIDTWPAAERIPGQVTATWLGVSTIVFDDGDTQILIDGFLTRPTLFDLLLRRPIQSSAADVNRALHRFRLDRVDAIVPTHTHFDHALDIAAVANRTGAVIFGSSSSAQIARGGNVPDEQIAVFSDGATLAFGDFEITLIESRHSPFGWRGGVPFDGSIDLPLRAPAPVSAWRSGKSFSVIVAHPQGTTLVQSSAGFVDDALDGIQADVVMLGTAMLSGLGRDYTQRYWLSLVTASGADVVVPLHFDDYTQAFGEVRLLPSFVDDFVKTMTWLKGLRDFWDTDVDILLPEFGVPMQLYAADSEPEA